MTGVGWGGELDPDSDHARERVAAWLRGEFGSVMEDATGGLPDAEWWLYEADELLARIAGYLS